MKYIKLFESFWGNEASGILPFCSSTKRFLIGFRSASVNEPHTWGNFGGAIGLDDYGDEEEHLSPEDNAIKEFEEETGFYGDIELVEAFTFRNDTFTYYNFIGVLDEEFDPTLNWENEDYEWVTLDEMQEYDLHFGLESLIEESYDLLEELEKGA